MFRKYFAFLVICLLVLGTAGTASAQTTTATSTATSTATTTDTIATTTATSTLSFAQFSSQVQGLVSQISALKVQLSKLLIDNIALVQNDPAKIKLLQEMLAADKTVYPSGAVTGYMGNLTIQGIRNFQMKHKMQVKGPAYLLQYGAGNSGKVPPGLQRAPGIQKKLAPATSSASTTTLFQKLFNKNKKAE